LQDASVPASIDTSLVRPDLQHAEGAMSKSARGLLALVYGAAVLLVIAETPATASAQPSPFQRGPERYVWVGPGSGLPPADLALIRDRVTDLFGSLPEVVVAPPTEPERHAIVSSRRLGRELLQISWTASTVPNSRGWDTQVVFTFTSTDPPRAARLAVATELVAVGGSRSVRLQDLGAMMVRLIVNWHEGVLGFPRGLGF
jgi:hypothetical protein